MSWIYHPIAAAALLATSNLQVGPGVCRAEARMIGQLTTRVSAVGKIRSNSRLLSANIRTNVPSAEIRSGGRLTGNLTVNYPYQGKVRVSERLVSIVPLIYHDVAEIRSTGRLTGVLTTKTTLAGRIRETERLSGVITITGVGTPATPVRVSERLYGTITTKIGVAGKIYSSERLTGQLITTIAPVIPPCVQTVVYDCQQAQVVIIESSVCDPVRESGLLYNGFATFNGDYEHLDSGPEPIPAPCTTSVVFSNVEPEVAIIPGTLCATNDTQGLLHNGFGFYNGAYKRP